MSDAGTAATLGRRRILVVEDEPLIGMLLEDMLTDLGYEVAASASRLDDAIKVAQEQQFHAAILDVNLNGHTIFPVAEILAQRRIPFLFATGYGEKGLPEAFQQHPTLEKPFHQDALQVTLAGLLD